MKKKQLLRNITMQAVKLKDPVKMEAFLTELYLQAFADGANAEVVEDGDRYLKLKVNHTYECQCPECGAFMDLDLLGLLEEEESNDS